MCNWDFGELGGGSFAERAGNILAFNKEIY